MRISSRAEHLVLFLGDLVVLAVSLWLTLLIRYQAIPEAPILNAHLQAFGVLFVIWLGVFFIAGLYEKHTAAMRSVLPSIILNTQILNSIIAVMFFYFVSYFGITPKTNLFIYLAVSFALMLLWRIYGYSLFETKRRSDALLVGTGNEVNELFNEVNSNARYSVSFTAHLELSQMTTDQLEYALLKAVKEDGVKVLVMDLNDLKVQALLPRLYNLLFSGVKCIALDTLYEQTFDRLPVSLLTYEWFLEHASETRNTSYDLIKRIMDIALSFSVGLVSLILYPFVWLAIKLDDGGKIFIAQERIGKGGKVMKIYKFRTMTTNDAGDENQKKENKITRVGGFLRKTRIDELPQLWNVLTGDMSMIGPRPEMPVYVALYDKEIPYYRVRHIIKPGLSGWAQLYHKNPPKVDADYNETRNKLSYDLYYIKHRSFFLDVKIALKTLKTFMSRSGK